VSVYFETAFEVLKKEANPLSLTLSGVTLFVFSYLPRMSARQKNL
jgi:hypothetical protein